MKPTLIESLRKCSQLQAQDGYPVSAKLLGDAVKALERFNTLVGDQDKLISKYYGMWQRSQIELERLRKGQNQ